MDARRISKMLRANVMCMANKYETKIEDYMVHREVSSLHSLIRNEEFSAFQLPEVGVKEPRTYIWEFLNEDELVAFVGLEHKSEVKSYIAGLIKDASLEKAHVATFVNLIYTVRKFCIAKEYNLEKTGAVLSQFYLTHLFFTSQFYVSAEKAYLYFKHLMMSNSLPFPPQCSKLFAFKESEEIMQFFCKIYLRNLPLIRFLSLPNFAFNLKYEIPEPEVEAKTKDKKGGAEKPTPKKGKKKK